MIDSLVTAQTSAGAIGKPCADTTERPSDASETRSESAPSPEPAPDMYRSLLSQVFRALTDPDGHSAGLKRLGEELKDEGPTQHWRFYYEEILGRSPETVTLAQMPVDAPTDAICAMLTSDEFLEKHDIVLQREFPQLTRDLFLHIPKSGGTTIFHAFESDDRFCSLHLFPNPYWFSDRLGYLKNTIRRLTNSKTRYVCLWDHPPAVRFLQNRLKRGWDNAFMTLRDPIDAGVSWINYVLTHVTNDASTHGEAITWRRQLGLPERPDIKSRAAALSLIPKIIDLFVPPNAICTTLGRAPNLESALEMAMILDLKIIPLVQVDDYIRYRGIGTYRRMNESERFVELFDLDHRSRVALYDKNDEDLKFYAWTVRHAITGPGPWLKL